MAWEIERQFRLLHKPEDLEDHPSEHIQQGYLAVSEEREVRIRAIDKHYTLTVKVGQGLSRQETNVLLTTAQFHELWPLTANQRLEKTRYHYPCEDQLWQVDIYHGPLSGFNVVEIEFVSEQESRLFRPNRFLGEELTATGSFYYLQKWLAGNNKLSGE